MNYHNITKNDMNNGDGIRVVLWLAGCEHHCEDCQNPQTWNYDSGIPFDEKAQSEILDELNKDYVAGITLSGGDPFAPKNRKEVKKFINLIHFWYPDKTIWIYTGYTYEQLLFEGDFDCVSALSLSDVLVDGKYMKSLRDVSLKWRGSKNQRVIDIQKSFNSGIAVLHCD